MRLLDKLLRRDWLWLPLLLGLIMAGVFALALLGHKLTHEHLADWLAATSTSAAFIAASVAGVFANRAYSAQVDQENSRRKTHRELYARLVSAWGHFEVSVPPSGRAQLVADQTFTVRNGGPMPIYDLAVKLELSRNANAGRERHVLRESQDVGLVAPGQTMELHWYGDAITTAKRIWDQSNQSDQRLELTLTFRDATGARWRLSPTGRLEDLGDV